MKVKARVIGKTGGKKMIIWHKRKKVIEQPVELVRDVWENSIPGYFKV